MAGKKQEEIKDEALETETADLVPSNEAKPMTKAEFQELIDNYKEQNPEKYALKKDELEAKLKALK